MQLLRVVSFVAVLSATAFAAGDKDQQQPKKDDEVSQADAEKFSVFFGKFVDAIVQNKECPKMAAAVSAVIDANQDVLKKANEARKAKKKLPKAIEEKMMARVKEMIPPMQKCGSDKAVQEAIAKMDKSGEK